MKIEAVDAFYFRMPEVLPIGDGSQDALLIRVSAGGFVGWGECEASPLTTIAALVTPMSHSACRPVLDSVVGESLLDAESIAHIHQKVKENSADLLQADHALSGIDVALWDLLGRSRGVPVWSLLGSTNLPKTAYASLLFGATPEETFSAAQQVPASYKAAKFGWGPIGKGSLEEDKAQLRAAREGLGPERRLMVDTGCAFGHDVARAASRISILEQCNVEWWRSRFQQGRWRSISSFLGRLRSRSRPERVRTPLTRPDTWWTMPGSAICRSTQDGLVALLRDGKRRFTRGMRECDL